MGSQTLWGWIKETIGDAAYSIFLWSINMTNDQYLYATGIYGIGFAEDALKSIAENTCCDKCQEAALVAKEALIKMEKSI